MENSPDPVGQTVKVPSSSSSASSVVAAAPEPHTPFWKKFMKRGRILSIGIALLVVTGIPATIFLSQQNQDNRQHAAGANEAPIAGISATATSSLVNPLPNQPSTDPSNVLDGNLATAWNSGKAAPQSIILNLGHPQMVTSMELVVAQTPAGQTTHNVYFSIDGNQWFLMHTFSGVTTYGQTLQWTVANAPSNVQYVKVETTQSPSWIAWSEIRVFGPAPVQAVTPTTTPLPPTPTAVQPTPNPLPPTRPPGQPTPTPLPPSGSDHCPMTNGPCPTITSITPQIGSVGTTINIVGTGFTGNTQILFNGHMVASNTLAVTYGTTGIQTKIPESLIGGCYAPSPGPYPAEQCGAITQPTPTAVGTYTISVLNDTGTGHNESNSLDLSVVTNPLPTPRPTGPVVTTTPNPLPTPRPTGIQTTNGSSALNLDLLLDGVGTAGDSTNPTNSETSTKSPRSPIQVSVEYFAPSDTDNTIAESFGTLSYDATSGSYKGGSSVCTGTTGGDINPTPNPLPNPRPTGPVDTGATPNPLPNPRPGPVITGTTPNPLPNPRPGPVITGAVPNPLPQPRASLPFIGKAYAQETTSATPSASFVSACDGVLADGDYVVKIKEASHLKRQIPNTVHIAAGQITTVPQITLVAGDANNDNVLDIQDWNQLLGGFLCAQGVTLDGVSCSAVTTPANDLNLDGTLDLIDLNLFLREIQVQHGD